MKSNGVTTDLQAIKSYFSKLGLSAEIADIYLALYAYGPQTLSELSRSARVERTKVYRLLNELTDNNLVEVELHHKKSILRAAPISNLQILLSKKEHELNELRSGLQELSSSFTPKILSSPVTRVQAYQGVRGLRQMFWNQTKSNSENVSILYENIQTPTDLAFFTRWVEKCNSKKIPFRSIICDNFILKQKLWYGKHDNERLQLWTGRYIPDSIFSITHSTVIYDDVTAYYNWKDGKVFGFEIYNQQVADSQRQFFEMLWDKSELFDDSVIENLRQQHLGQVRS